MRILDRSVWRYGQLVSRWTGWDTVRRYGVLHEGYSRVFVALYEYSAVLRLGVALLNEDIVRVFGGTSRLSCAFRAVWWAVYIRRDTVGTVFGCKVSL